jgi:integrase/recombinase XerC
MGVELNTTKFLSPDEIEALMTTIRATRESSARDSLMLELALKIGCRACELIPSVGVDGKETGIRKSDLNKSLKTVHIRGLKGSRDRDVGIKPELFSRILKYAETVEGEYLFPISYQRLDQVWREYRPVRKSLHSLRHTFAVELYKKTKDVLLLKRALGHVNLANTMVYTTAMTTAEDFRRMAL